MEAGIERALRRLGHRTLLLDDRRVKHKLGWALTQRWVRWRAERFRPDFVFLSKCLALDPETVRGIIAGRPNAMWYHDPHWYGHTGRRDVGHILEIGRLAQTFFVTGFEAEWRAHGLNARFLPAAGAREIVPGSPEPRFGADVAFIGSAYDEARVRFLLALHRRVPLRIWGPQWKRYAENLDWTGRTVEQRDFARVCSSSAIVLGANPGLARGATTYASDRMWMVMLAGGFYLGAGTPGMDRMLLDGVHCAWYADLEDCVAKARYYLAHPDERSRIRAAGEAFVREHHTYDARVEYLLSGRPWVSPLSASGATAA